MKNINSYPSTYDQAFSLFLNHKKTKRPLPYKDKDQNNDVDIKKGVALAQKEVKPTPDMNRKVHSNINCLRSGEIGHYTNKCLKVIEVNLYQLGVIFNQVSAE